MTLIIVFSLLLVLNAFWDQWLIQDGGYINHLKSTLAWIVVYVILGMATIFASELTVGLVWRIAAVFLPIRWILHDMILNGLRGKEWDYLSSGDKGAYLDKQLGKLPFHFIWLKLVIFIGVLGLALA